MKTKLVLLIAMAGIFTFSSCKRCVDCQLNDPPYTSYEFCKPNSETRKDWNEYLESWEEGMNATCK